MSFMTPPKAPGTPGHVRVIHPDDEGFWRQTNELALELAKQYGVVGFKGVEPKPRPNGHSAWMYYDNGYLYISFRYKNDARNGGTWNDKPYGCDTVMRWLCEGLAAFSAGKDAGERSRLSDQFLKDCGLRVAGPVLARPSEQVGTVIMHCSINPNVRLELVAGNEDYNLSIVQRQGGVVVGVPLGSFNDVVAGRRAIDEFRHWAMRYGNRSVEAKT